MAREADWAQISLPSGEIRRIPADCRATIGECSNPDNFGIVLGKAGRKRWMGRRPHVRGIAMNPVDHPHGGGEGRSKGNHPTSPWGTPTKGYRTRRNKKTSGLIVPVQNLIAIASLSSTPMPTGHLICCVSSIANGRAISMIWEMP